MTARVGVLRTASGLATAADRIAELAVDGSDDVPAELAAWETTNLLTVAAALTAAAAAREETRGSHWRDDHPARDDERWSGHVDVTLDEDGAVAVLFRPAPPSDAPASLAPETSPTQPTPEIV
ncbi:hypothetical protein [Nocardioides zeae]